MLEIAGGIVLAVLALVVGGAILFAALRNAKAIGVLLCTLFFIVLVAEGLFRG